MNPRLLSDRGALGAVILACVIWGSSFFFAKIALAELSVGHVVLWRFAIATALLAPLAARRGLPRRRDLPLFALTGVLCVPVSLVVQFEGLARTSVASASLVVGTGTPLLALAGAAFRCEHIGARGWIAVALSTVGLAVVVGLPGPGRSWLGDLLVFASMVVTTGWVILGMPLVARYGGLMATAWILGTGAVVQLPVTWLMDGAPRVPESAVGWGALLTLGILCTGLAFALWNRGLERVEAARAGVYINLEPVVGALLGVMLLGDRMSPALAGGGIIVLAASLLASLPPRRHAESVGAAAVETPSPAPSRKAA